MKRLLDGYNQYFRVIHADTDELRDTSYRLRYQAFAVEHGILDRANYSDHREVDDYDDRSEHYLLQHIPSGRFAGSVRIVLPVPDSGFPIHHYCTEQRIRDPSLLPPLASGEISRFNITKEFLRRAGDDRYSGNGPPARLSTRGAREARRGAPYLALGLMQAAVHCAAWRHLSHVAAVMAPSLLRVLGRDGIRFEPVGDLVEYNGPRQPCVRPLRELLDEVRCEHREVWEVLTNDGAYYDALPSASVPVDDAHRGTVAAGAATTI